MTDIFASDREWCPVCLRWEDAEEWAACDDALYNEGYRDTPVGPVKVFGEGGLLADEPKPT